MPTIVAIATPPGHGGISIIRLSGPGAKTLLARAFLPHSSSFTNFRPWTLHRGALLDEHDLPLDDVLAVYMPAPRTYTGEEMAEIHCHGGVAIANTAMETFLRLGARLAEPGEFTRRAFLNGRMDLTQAEAVAELINAPSREAMKNSFNRLEGRLGLLVDSLARQVDELRALCRVGVDFPEEEVECLDYTEFNSRVEKIVQGIEGLLANAERARLMANGARVLLMGPVNVGKSSIFNLLTGIERSLVTDIPGTTRDYVEVSLYVEGLPLTLIDTAGMHPGAVDKVEKLGIEKTYKLLDDADMVCFVVDEISVKEKNILPEIYKLINRYKGKPVLLIRNKVDLGQYDVELPINSISLPSLAVSALDGTNIDKLPQKIHGMLMANSGSIGGGDTPPNMRQAENLRKAMEELQALLQAIKENMPYDCCLSYLDLAFEHLGRVIGLAPDEVILEQIFSKFCIGK